MNNRFGGDEMSCHAGRSRRRVGTVVVCALAALGAVASTGVPDRPADQQNQPPTFRARVDLVEIDLVATDAAGRRVLDLQKDELQVLEGGKLRENASLALVNLPLPAPHPPYAQDVASNTATDNGRLFFLILDDVHTLRERSDAVKAVARRFVERLSPGDQVAVAWVGLGNAGARSSPRTTPPSRPRLTASRPPAAESPGGIRPIRHCRSSPVWTTARPTRRAILLH